MSKGLTSIAFIFMLPFLVLGGLWLLAKRGAVAGKTVIMGAGSAQGTAPKGAAQPATSSAQGTAPGGTGANTVLQSAATVITAATPIIQGFLDRFTNDNSDYVPDATEAAVPADTVIDSPALDAVDGFSDFGF